MGILDDQLRIDMERQKAEELQRYKESGGAFFGKTHKHKRTGITRTPLKMRVEKRRAKNKMACQSRKKQVKK